MQVPLPAYPEEQRFEVIELGVPGFYRVICHIGYTDSVPHNNAFLESLLQAIVTEARLKALIAK